MPSPFPIAPILPGLDRIKIIDIGAMSLGDGSEVYADLARTTPCEVVGFEPVAAECEKLNASARPGLTFLPYAVGDGESRTFYECNFPMTSSLFEPNSELMARFQNLEELARVVKTYPVQTVRLDDVAAARGADLIKLDVQGAELMVIENATETLRSASVVIAEVSFVPLYKAQPLFADIAMRARGFVLNRIAPAGRAFKPMILGGNVNAPSQHLWADAVYVRDFMTLDTIPPASLLKMAAILHEATNSCDLAAVALDTHDRLTGSQFQRNYLRRFGL